MGQKINAIATFEGVDKEGKSLKLIIGTDKSFYIVKKNGKKELLPQLSYRMEDQNNLIFYSIYKKSDGSNHFSFISANIENLLTDPHGYIKFSREYQINYSLKSADIRFNMLLSNKLEDFNKNRRALP